MATCWKSPRLPSIPISKNFQRKSDMNQQDSKTYRLKTDDLVDAVQAKLDDKGVQLSKKDIRAVIDATTESIGDTFVAQLGKFFAVSVKGLGRFSYRLNSGKTHVATKEPVPESVTLSYSACDELRNRLSDAKTKKVVGFLKGK